jgi:diguanylate cyclase (GGDEF)-like protein
MNDGGVLETGRWHASRTFTCGIGAGLALYVAWLVATSGSVGNRKLIVDAVSVLLGGAVVISMVIASRRCAADARTASAWRMLALAFTFLTAAYTVWLIYAAVDASLPFPSGADVGFLLFYPLFLGGLLRFPTEAKSRAAERRLLLDGVIIALAATSVIWFLVLGPTVAASGRTLFEGAVAAAYPVGDLVQLCGVIYLVTRAPAPETRRSLHVLAVAAALAVTGNVVYTWSSVHANASVLLISDIAWASALVLYLLAAANQAPLDGAHQPDGVDAHEAAEARARDAAASRWLAYSAPAVVFGLLIAAQFDSPAYQRLGLAACASVMTFLVFSRQILAQRELISAQGQLSYQAMHDALTGLPNRALVLDRATQMVARARRHRLPVAAVYVDIDGFKNVNDTFGHAAGDELIQAVADRLSGVIRGSDTVGRIGGDEFVVLLDSPTLDVAPELVAERMLEVLREPVELETAGQRSITVTGSLGVATTVTDGADQLLANADMALYQAKASGKNRVAIFESGMQAAAQDRLLLEMDLRAAVDRGEFFLLYQPTFDLRSESITGVEALLRWRHPTRGVIEPDLFVPIAEETGIIVPVGRWVLSEACAQAAKWHHEGHPVGVSVNVSARQLDNDGELVAHVRAGLAESRLAPSALTLEITETALMHDPAVAAARLGALKALGVRIAIDDFGTGYSSMAYLRQFPVDALKIDRSFISGLDVSNGAAEILRSLVQLGKSLGLETLGEGIEEHDQLRSLQREDCDSGQGFLFARPLAPQEMSTFIERYSGSEVGHG